MNRPTFTRFTLTLILIMAFALTQGSITGDTTSPLFKVALSPPKLPTNIELDMTLFQADPEIDGRTMINRDFILRKVAPLHDERQLRV